MLVIVTEAVPDRLRGFLSRYFLEVRAGVFLGDYSRRVREMIVKKVGENLETGNVVVAWTTDNESGFDFETYGNDRRVPLQLDGFKLVSFLPASTQTAQVQDLNDRSLTLQEKGKTSSEALVKDLPSSNSSG